MSIDKRLISTAAAAPAGCTTDTLDIFEDSSCVALYGLNYDASDASGNYNGIAAGVTFNAPGYIDYAAEFQYAAANGDYIQITNDSFFRQKQTFSMSMWFKTASSASNNLRLFSDYNLTSYNMFSEITSTGKIKVSNRFNNNTNTFESTGTYDDTNWHHLVITNDVANLEQKIYIDGSLLGTTSMSSASWVTGSTGKVGIGASYSTGNARWQNSFDGLIDQVRIFNKALSAAEVTTLYGETSCEYTCTTDTNGFPASASSDLVAYYKLDNDATDETASYNGTETSITYDGGRYGSSASFNGSSSYIETPLTYNTIVDVNDKTQDFSFSLWMYQHTQDTVNTANVFAINEFAPTYQYVGLNISPSGNLQWVQYPGGASGVNANTPTTLNQWIHVACVRENSSLKIYKNGTLEDTVAHTISNNTLDSTIKWVFGARLDGGNDLYFDGEIDQVRIYDKALSSTEVSTMYEDEHQCYITVDSTDPFGDSSNIALYEFENNANDSTGSYNGTASNVTYSTDSIIGTYAASFNGSSSTITLPITTSDLGANSACSISWWWKPSTSGTTIDFLFEANAADVFMIHTGGGAGSQGLRVGVKNTSETPFQLDVTNAYTTGVWQHHVATFGNNKIRLYKNGNLIGSLDYNGTIKTISNIAIGNRPSNAYWYSGELDQVRIFNRALNGDEVWKLYAEGAKG